MTWLNAPSGKKQDWLPVRAAEHSVILPCGDGKAVSGTCTVITTLLDHQAAPADQVRGTYLTRWSASETTFGEDKTTITGAGNRTSGPVLRSGPRGWSSPKPGPGSPWRSRRGVLARMLMRKDSCSQRGRRSLTEC